MADALFFSDSEMVIEVTTENDQGHHKEEDGLPIQAGHEWPL
jgi:hypothetical protein